MNPTDKKRLEEIRARIERRKTPSGILDTRDDESAFLLAELDRTKQYLSRMDRWQQCLTWDGCANQVVALEATTDERRVADLARIRDMLKSLNPYRHEAE